MKPAIKLICFYGPESTGKSFMAERMAKKYHTVFVPEVAREMITSNDFSAQDIIDIGYAHYQRIQEKLKIANRFLFCDTDAITTQIYSEYYLHTVPPVLYELESLVRFDHYFLFDVDVPWIPDGLRDLNHRRQEMFSIFESVLKERNIDYTLVKGNWEERETIVIQKLEALDA